MPSKQSGTTNDQNLLICVRIRPMSKEEVRRQAMKVCYRVDEKLICLIDPAEDADFGIRGKRARNREYTFDHAFDESSSQEDVFQATTSSLIEHVANGYNATVFASGATGAGKTYTMVGTGEDPGIMVRAMEELFNHMIHTSDDYVYTIAMAYMELYNELLRDLFNPGPDYLELREDAKGIQVAGLTEVEPTNRQEVFELLARGNQNRTTEPTAANLTSSRSHAILQITVRRRSRVPNVNEEVHVGKLFLIDLAGSERASKTLNRGKRMTEGAHINRSLLALGNCINALADTNGKRYVNFRDSKLTRLLKEALAGNCRTVMIAHISPSSWYFEESYNTLVYADRAKSIKTKVRRNVVDVNHHISQYTHLIEELREEISRLKSNMNSASDSKSPDALSLQLSQLKETLLDAYHKHLDLRRELVSVRNKLLEVELEETRQNLIVSEWDCSRLSNCNISTYADSQTNLNDGVSMDPVVVEIARKRFGAFQEERMVLEANRERIEKEHKQAETQVKKLQSTLLLQTRSTEEREVITLLGRLHELELERADLDARYAVSDTELKKREFLLDQLRQDSRLSEMIIRYQCTLLDHNKVEKPKELEQLLELYEHQFQGCGGMERRISFAGSSMDFKSNTQPTSNELRAKLSISLSSLPTEAGLDKNRYMRTVKWLEYSGSRRASDADQASQFSLVPGTDQANGTLARPVRGRSRQDQSRVVSRLDTTNRAISHPELGLFSAQTESDNSQSSSSENVQNHSDVATKTISAVAQQRRDRKIRERAQELRNQNSVNASQSGNTVLSSTLSDIGENPELTSSPRAPTFTLTPSSSEVDQWPVVAGSRIVMEAQKLPSRRTTRSQREDRPDSTGTHNGNGRVTTGCARQLSQTESQEHNQGPFIRAVKVTPLELKAQRLNTSSKQNKPRTTAPKSGIPRSRSTPRNGQQTQLCTTAKGSDAAPILQVPQLVRVNDRHGEDQAGSKASKLPPRRIHSEWPLQQQKTAVERRQQRMFNQMENS